MTGPSLFTLFKAGPIGLIRRAVFKTFIGPLVYGRNGSFDAARYWRDRFRKYGEGMRGSGFEGLPDRDNQRLKDEAATDLLSLCRQEGIDPERDPILDIGCGAGYITRHFRAAGSRNYTGLDVVDVLFPTLRASYPDFRFQQTEITSQKIGGRYRLIFMLDVIQSVVTPEGLKFAMENIRDSLEDGGVFIIAPLFEATRKVHFYACQWSREDVLAHFPGFVSGETRPFRDLRMHALRKPAKGAAAAAPRGP